MGKKHMGVNIRKRDEFNDYLDEINVKRALISSIVFSVAMPFIILIINVIRPPHSFIWTTMFISIFAEMFQIIYAFLLFHLLKNKEMIRYRVAYVIYYGATIAPMMCVAAFEMDHSGSQVLYVAVCVYFIFVPIFNEKVRDLFIAGQTVILLSLMLVVDMSIRCLFDTAIMQISTVFISRYQYNLTKRIAKTSENLKKKTLYSEQDALTGLTNRRGLKKKAEAIWTYCQRKKVPVGIIALDIDFFKKYNDKFGHVEGDKCLKLIADTLRESAKRDTDIVTRTGGEEFLIFVQDITPKELLSLALKIRKNIEKQSIIHAYCGISKYVTVSIGISTTIPKSNYQFIDLYEEADRALYLAKKHGRNCIVFDGNLYGRMKNGMSQVISMNSDFY